MQEDGSGAAPAAGGAEGSAQSEGVQSNLVLPSEDQEAQGPLRRHPQQQQQQQQQQPAGIAALLPGLHLAAAQPAATTQTGALSVAFAPVLAPPAPVLAPAAEPQPTVVSPAAAAAEQQVSAAAAPPAQQQQPLLDMQGWRQLQTTPIGGSLPAAGSGSGARGSHDRSGHATMTGVLSAEPGALRSLGAGGSGSHAPPDGSPPEALQRAPQALPAAAAVGFQGSNKLGGSGGDAPPGGGQCEAQSPHAGHKRQRSPGPEPGARHS